MNFCVMNLRPPPTRKHHLPLMAALEHGDELSSDTGDLKVIEIVAVFVRKFVMFVTLEHVL